MELPPHRKRSSGGLSSHRGQGQPQSAREHPRIHPVARDLQRGGTVDAWGVAGVKRRSEMGWRNGLRLSQFVADLLPKNLGMKIHLGYPIWTPQIHCLKSSKKTVKPLSPFAKIMGRSCPIIPWAWVSQNHQSREWSVQIQTWPFRTLSRRLKLAFDPVLHQCTNGYFSGYPTVYFLMRYPK